MVTKSLYTLTNAESSKNVSKNIKTQDQDEWTQIFIRTVVIENIKLLSDEEKRLGPQYRGHLFSSFLASYVGALAYTPLNSTKSVTSKSFLMIKSIVEEAVSAGFTGAVAQALTDKLEFYCQVKTVPEPQSKKVN